jgi:hypothetical protein
MTTFQITSALMLATPFAILTACAVDEGRSADELAANAPGPASAEVDDDDRNPAPLDPTEPYDPDFDPADLDTHIDQPMFPLPVGAKWKYRSVTEDGVEIIRVTVLPGTVAIGGTRARAVRDTAHLDGVLIESTTDWFAQDDDDNVWYLGEATVKITDGVSSPEGSWKTGVDGAQPGVVMLARPRLRDTYRQEYLAGHAEDYAKVVGFGKTVSVPAGTFHGCMQTRDRSTLDLALDELKTYCPGIGLVLTEEGGVREELISYSGL